MKHKLIFASVGILGLISNLALAHTQTQSQAASYQHKKTHHVTEVQYKGDYKDMGALPTIVVPQVDLHQLRYDAMSQNTGRSKAMPDWFNRIGISGGLNVDGHWGNRTSGYMGENYVRVSVNDAYMNISANINDWAKAFSSLSYSNFSGPNGVIGGSYSTAYTNDLINLEQGYVTIGNFAVSPIFFQVGKQFTDYGRYQIHPLVRTMAEVMTESLQPSAKLGFITQGGLHGDIYAFDNPATQFRHQHSNTIYGAALGFDQINDYIGFDVGIGYMSNIVGVNDIRSMIGNAPFFNRNYVHLVGGLAVYADVNSGPFSISARYTSAIQQFNPVDLSTQFENPFASGARPWAADVTGGYNFNAWSRSQNLYIGLQSSNFAVNLGLPRTRLLIGYNIDMWKNTNVGFEWDHDKAYSSGNRGTGRSENIVGARASIKFG
ncbi:MAG: LbtU family siderophore porin [Gammaproteobacteria bacterium]|nr:LbtU family siderophore porin [Gammaproteobacteria bacterium]